MVFWKKSAKSHALSKGRDAAARVRALQEIVDEPKSDRALHALLTTFVEALLERASTEKALAAAGDAYFADEAPELGERPGTHGKGALSGTKDLDFSPYELRRSIAVVADALGREARKERRLLLWLFECLKLWANHERGVAFQALLQAEPTDDEIAAGVKELCRYALATGYGEALETVACRCREKRFAMPLLAELTASPEGGDAMVETELRNPITAETPEWLSELSTDEAATIDAAIRSRSATARAVALTLVARNAAYRETAARAAARMMREKPKKRGRAVSRAARVVLATGLVDDHVAEAARAALEKAGRREQELLQAVLATHEWNHAGDVKVTSEGGFTLFELPFSIDYHLAALNDGIYAAFNEPRIVTAGGDWLTNDECVGLVRIGYEGEALSRIELPVELPAVPSGGNGAKRDFDIDAVVDGAAILRLESPFSDSESWGKRNFLFAYRTATGSFSTLDSEQKESPLERRVAVSDLPLISHGELIVWQRADGSLTWEVDGTPYHLDDWEHTPEVRRALDARHESQRSSPWRHVEMGNRAPLKKTKWTLKEGDGKFRVKKAGRFVRDAWPIASEGDLIVLGGVRFERQEREQVALALRVFVRGPGRRSFDAILRAPATVCS